jgi:uncharacterized protein YndB with AHSA1/START domain
MREPSEIVGDWGRASDAQTLRFERVLPGPIERIWKYLTDADLRARWFAGGPMELRPGGRLELKFQHRNLSDVRDEPPEAYREMNETGFVSHLKVLRVEPPRLLAYTFDEDDADPSVVTFELTPQGEDVRLVLTHSNIRKRDDMINFAGGWHAHLAVLQFEAEGRPRPPFWGLWATTQGQYDSRL